MYGVLGRKFQHYIDTEIRQDQKDFYPFEDFERSIPEIEFFNQNYKYFNNLVRTVFPPTAPCNYKKRILNDIILSNEKRYEPCSAEVALANNFTLKNLAFLRLHKSLKHTTFHRVNSFLEDHGYQTRLISCLKIPHTLKVHLFLLQNCKRHSNLIIERPLNLKSCLRYRIMPETEAYENIVKKYDAFASNLTLSLLDSFAMIKEISLLTHSISEATDLFYDNVASMQKYIFREV